MKNEAEIPCSACASWNQKAKTFKCNPNYCEKLSDWLLENAQSANPDTLQIEQAQAQYIV
ncbi:MAG: hypothetical protein ACE14S_02085 [Candidatus Bathyarchaeia archaeon]